MVDTELKIGDKVKINQALKNKKNKTVNGLWITPDMCKDHYYDNVYEIHNINGNSAKLISRDTILEYLWPLSYLIKKEVVTELKIGDKVKINQELKNKIGTFVDKLWIQEGMFNSECYDKEFEIYSIDKFDNSAKLISRTEKGDVIQSYGWPISYLIPLESNTEFKIGDRIRIDSSLRKITTNRVDEIFINDEMKTKDSFYNKEWIITHIDNSSLRLKDDYHQTSGYWWPKSYIRKVIDISGSQGFNGIPSSYQHKSSNPCGEIYLGSNESKTDSNHIKEVKSIKIGSKVKLSINKSKKQSYDSIKVQGSNIKIASSSRIRGTGLTSTRSKI